MDSDMELTRVMYEGILGEKAQVTTSLDGVLARLAGGEKGIIVEVPWDETINDERYDRAQIVLMRLSGDRVFYCNPLPGRHLQAGETGGVTGRGPFRRIEPSGEESMDVATFRRLFSQGGSAILGV